MIVLELEKTLKNSKSNEQQNRYCESLKRFKTLIDKGVVTERKNQLLVDNSKTKYNIK